MINNRFVLALSCPDRPGIVADVSAFLFAKGGNIPDAQQFDDIETGLFFMRIVFRFVPGAWDRCDARGA